MILATTIAPVDLSLLIVAPLRMMISELKDGGHTDEQMHRGKEVNSENNMLILLQSRQASYLEPLHSSGGYLY